MKNTSRWLVAMLLAASFSIATAQVTRGTITGVVKDSSDAVIPAAEVFAKNVATGVEYSAQTTETGVYTINALPIGAYSLRVRTSGFREHQHSGLNLASGQTIRLDVVLQVGELVEQVTVSAEASLLETETSQVTESVSSSLFASLPLGFGGGGRNMADFADKLVPGVDGSAWNLRIQGTPGGTAGVLVDGMTNLAGFLPGDFAEASISPEAIEELTVVTGSADAENSRQSGGSLSFTLKSGTNDFHGSAFYYFRNEGLNANQWNNNLNGVARPRDRRTTGGFSVGGPVIVPGYNGRNRTFFHFTLEKFDNSTEGQGPLNRTVPHPEMWQGDLGRLLTGRIVGTDALGRPVQEGQIYDPATLSQVDGRWVAEPFTNNVIPSNRISNVGRNFGQIFNEWYPPANSNLLNNLYFTNFNAQTVDQYTLKLDHSFNANHKVSGYWYRHKLPRDFQEGGASQVWSQKDPTLGGPLSRSIRQQRRGYNWSANYDWIVSPTKLNHLQVGLNDNKNGFASRQLGKQFADAWGITGVGLEGVPDDQVTRPFIDLGGTNAVAQFESFGHDANRDDFYKAIVVSNTFSWQHGNHSLKFGFEWNRMRWEHPGYDNTGGTFRFRSRTTAIPGEPFTAQIGNSLASLLLGEVDSANLTPVLVPTYYRGYTAVFMHDNWKATPRLTLNYGLRWSGNSSITESEDRMAMFNPNLVDPNIGIRGAVEYMGDGTGRAGRDSFYPGTWNDLGPSFGFAYRVTDKIVARGGYGISFTPEGYGWELLPFAGFNQNNNVAADSEGLFRPVFNIDDGYQGQTTPADLDPSWATRNSGQIYHPGFTQSGYIQTFNFGLQFEAKQNLLFEIDYRGNKGTRLHADGLVSPNQIRPEELSRGSVLTQQITSPEQAAAAGLPYPYAGFSGQGAWTLLPFPQMGNRTLGTTGDPAGFSTYHSLNFITTKRMSRGLFAYGAYTFSKNIANVTTSANGGDSGAGLQSTFDRPKSIAPNDRTHVVKGAANWELPFGRGRAIGSGAGGALNALIGGWSVSAIVNFRTGTALSRPNSRTRPNFWNGPGVWANFVEPAGGFKSLWNPDTFNPNNPTDPGNRFFDPAAFTDAAPQSLGTAPARFPQVRMPSAWSEDLSILKMISIRENVGLQLRAELLNAFNRHFFSGPEMNMNSPSFGNIWQVSNASARIIQLGVRLEF